MIIGWGILGLIKGDFAPGWQPFPESAPVRPELANLTAIICIAAGVGLLWRPTATIFSRLFFFWFVLWLLLLRLPWMMIAFGIDHWWSASATAMMTGAVWVLYVSLASDQSQHKTGFLAGDRGLLAARVLFGLGLIPIGLAHFLYVEATAPLVPAWLQWPLFWAYFTGVTFIVAGLAIVTGIFGRLAASLVTLQIALMTLIVWIPLAIAGRLSAFQWGELEVSIILTACAWVVADSYRGVGWFAIGSRRTLI